ncbi:MAG: hypothetical protein ACRC41_18100 [Sarcina sp.]
MKDILEKLEVMQKEVDKANRRVKWLAEAITYGQLEMDEDCGCWFNELDEHIDNVQREIESLIEGLED